MAEQVEWTSLSACSAPSPFEPIGDLCERQTFAKHKNTATELGAVHKLHLQEEGGRWSKKLTFCKLSYHRKCKRRGVGGQKKAKFCKRSL